MLSLKPSKDVSKRSKAENKGKKEKKRLRIAQLDDKDVFESPYLQGMEARRTRAGVGR